MCIHVYRSLLNNTNGNNDIEQSKSFSLIQVTAPIRDYTYKSRVYKGRVLCHRNDQQHYSSIIDKYPVNIYLAIPRKSRQRRKPVNYAKNVEARSRRRHDPMFAIHYEGNAKYKCKPRSNRTYPDRHSPSSDVEEEGLSRKSLRCQQPRHPLSPVATAPFYNLSCTSNRLNFSSVNRSRLLICKSLHRYYVARHREVLN